MTAPLDRPATGRQAVDALEDVFGINPHQPARPAWTCRNDGQPWPCSPARVHLNEAYSGDRPGLSTLMNTLLNAAVYEMPNTPPGELFDQFINWTR